MGGTLRRPRLAACTQGGLTDPFVMGSTTLQRYWMGYSRPEGFSNWTSVGGAAAPLVPASSPYAHW